MIHQHMVTSSFFLGFGRQGKFDEVATPGDPSWFHIIADLKDIEGMRSETIVGLKTILSSVPDLGLTVSTSTKKNSKEIRLVLVHHRLHTISVLFLISVPLRKTLFFPLPFLI